MFSSQSLQVRTRQIPLKRPKRWEDEEWRGYWILILEVLSLLEFKGLEVSGCIRAWMKLRRGWLPLRSPCSRRPIKRLELWTCAIPCQSALHRSDMTLKIDTNVPSVSVCLSVLSLFHHQLFSVCLKALMLPFCGALHYLSSCNSRRLRSARMRV